MARFYLTKLAIIALLAQDTFSFSIVGVPNNKIISTPSSSLSFTSSISIITKTTLFNTSPSEEEMEEAISNSKLSPEEVVQVGNLVQDDEWMGLGMELSELVRTAVIEEVKKNTADFIGKDDYKVGDITKEIDSRVKVSQSR